MPLADVATAAEAEALATRIMGPRTRPLVLVSTLPDGGFHFDVDRLRRELDGVADVLTIETGSTSRTLEVLLPPKTHTFAGAARSYPVGFGADPAWTRSRLRFPEHADTDDLIDDAVAQSVRRTIESAPAPSLRRVSGIVKGFLADGTRALVELDDGTTVTATAALLPPDIPLTAALVAGGPVAGILDGVELRPEPLAPDLDAFGDGAHTRALVVKVTDLRATVHLHPSRPFVLRRRDVSADELPVGEVLAVGDIIRVRVSRSGGELSLSHSDVDDETPTTPALPLVTGAPPWLSEDRVDDLSAAAPRTAPQPAERSGHPTAGQQPADEHATRTDIRMLSQAIAALRGDVLALTNRVARGAGAPGDSELEQLRAENMRLRAEVADERAERARAEARLSEASQSQREAGRALRDARRAAERAHVDPTEDGIRFEIERTWGNRTAPGERGRWPLREFRLGPDFIASLSGLDESQLSKAVRACVDAITGRDREIPARDLHRLRTGEGGGDAYVVRADGAKCWRAAIEQNVPGARRLHYWELPGNEIELSRIVLHDDTKP